MSSQTANASYDVTKPDAAMLGRSRWNPGWAVLGLATIGLGLTGYLSVSAWGRGTIAGCGAGIACDQAMSSAWAWWLGVPVSALAAGTYGLVLAATLLAIFGGPRAQRHAWTILPALALMLMGAAAWFIYVLVARIGAMCAYCTASHLIGLITAGLIFIGTATVRCPVEKSRLINLQRCGLAAILAAVGMTTLVGVQELRPTATYAMVDASSLSRQPQSQTQGLHDGHGHDGDDHQGHDHEHPDPAELQRRWKEAQATADAKLLSGGDAIYSQRDGRRVIAPAFTDIVLDPYELPMMGSPDAEHLLVFFFDYTCETCRKTHNMLRQVHQTFGHQIAVLLVPWPTGSACNPVLAEMGVAGSDSSCKYARLGLALWRVSPQVFGQFDDWLSRFRTVPPIDLGVKQAIDLAGREPLEAALKDPWVDAQLQRYIKFTRPVMEHFRGTPIILMGDKFMQGIPEDAQAFAKLLEEQLGVTPAIAARRP